VAVVYLAKRIGQMAIRLYGLSTYRFLLDLLKETRFIDLLTELARVHFNKALMMNGKGTVKTA